jgi:hypothetical protein
VNSRQDVEPVLSGSLPASLRQLGDRPYQPAGEAVGIGEEPREGLPCDRGPATAAEATHRQDCSGRVAGEEVAQCQPVIGKQPSPGVGALLDDRGIVWPVRDQDSA